jgi:hypothetical protein
MVAHLWQAEGHCWFIGFRSGGILVVFEGSIVVFKVLSAGCVSHAAGFVSEKMLLSCKRAVNLHHAWNATFFGTAICIRPLTMYTRSYEDVEERPC